MPSEYGLSGVGWSASGFGGIPSPDEFDIECDRCGAVESNSEAEGWKTVHDRNDWTTELVCPDCRGNGV